MAKASPKNAAKPVAKSTRPSPAAVKTAKTGKAAAPAKAAVAVKAPAVSKDELRAQLEKAQNTIALLRTKSREAVRAAKLAAAQIAEFEAKVAQLENKLTKQEKPAKEAALATKPANQHGRKATGKADVAASAETDEPSVSAADTVADK
jgi:hypothetical protein